MHHYPTLPRLRPRRPPSLLALRSWVLVCALLLPSQLFSAEPQIQVATQSAPHYIGEPVQIRVSVAGFAEEPQPKCTIKSQSPGLEVQLVGVTPSVREFFSNINGRTTRSRNVTLHFNYYVTATEEGEYSVGPFVVEQQGQRVEYRAVNFSFETIDDDPDMRIRLELDDKPVYPGQRVGVKIEWSYSGDLRSVRKLAIRSPLFDQFTFEDPPAARTGNALPIQTAKGALELPATAREETVDGKTFTVVTARRKLVPERPGQFEIPPITASIRKITRWRRDAFGFAEPADVVPVRATGNPVVLQVKSLPVDGRPDSFAGAIGDAFSLDVTADRTVIRVGDPVTLNIMLRGSGNLKNAGLAPLTAGGGLSPEQFRVPEADVAGSISPDAKQFQVQVRVLDESVRAIPALEYSWFDPNRESYQTTSSDPIALRVDPAQIVSAGDVVSSQPNLPANPESAPPRTMGTDVSPGSSGLSMIGADLAIEQDLQLLMRSAASGFGGWPVRMLFYVAGLALIAVAVWDRRRQNVDPEIVRCRQLLREQGRRIKAAATLGTTAAAAQIATSLRAVAAGHPDVDRQQLERIVADCESVTYAPQSTADVTIAASLSQQAIQLIQNLE